MSATFTHSHSRRSTADPDRLWALLCDVDGWVAWNDGIESIRLSGPLAVGATFVMTPPGEAPLTSTVVALEPRRLLTDRTVVDGVTVDVEHRLDPGADGTTIVFAMTVSGDAPLEVLREIGEGAGADFPDVIAGLDRAAQG